MSDIDHEIGCPGLVSAMRLRELVSRAADAGVLWPSPLMPLIDDNIRRGGIFKGAA